MERPGYMMIKEAAVHYGVSRAKLHRLIQLGRLRTTKDPRDERATLLRTEDVEAIFRFPAEEAEEMVYKTEVAKWEEPTGRITKDWCDRVDAFRMRISRGRRLPQDSAEIIRGEREKRGGEVYQAVFGADENAERVDRQE